MFNKEIITFMKTKKALFLAAFAAVTLLSGYNYVQNNSEVKLSDLALANVEALASGEIEQLYGFYLHEYSSSCKVCERGGTKCYVSSQMPCY